MLRGQAHLMDASVAFIVMAFSVSFFMASLLWHHQRLAEDYQRFDAQRRMLDESQRIISGEKHHRVDAESIETTYGLRVVYLEGGVLQRGGAEGNVVRRIALCGGERCVIELWEMQG